MFFVIEYQVNQNIFFKGAVSKFPKPEELRFKTKSDGFVSI